MIRDQRIMQMKTHSLRIDDTRYIRRVIEQYKNEDRHLETCCLNLGDPTIYGFPPPVELTKAFKNAIKEPPSYTASVGYPPLLEECRYGRPRLKNNQIISTYRLEPNDAINFISPGSSGAIRLFLEIVAGGKNQKAIIFVPELTYPLFLAEANLVEAEIIIVPLNQTTGLIDLDKLDNLLKKAIETYGSITQYIIVNTSIGNPLGSAMDIETFNGITTIINKYVKKFNTKIYRITDPIYEAFRRKGNMFDPVYHILHTNNSNAIECVTWSLSKVGCWPGQRIGGATVFTSLDSIKKKFMQQFLDYINTIYAISLGTVNIYVQIAAANWLHDIRTNMHAFIEEQDRITSMRERVHTNVATFAKSLGNINGVELHPYYYHSDGTPRYEDMLNSFYVLWRFKYDREKISQAARFAEWTLNRALREIKNNNAQKTPVIFMNDGDMFLARHQRGLAPQFIRTVALNDPDKMEPILDLIQEFASIISTSGKPPPRVDTNKLI